MDYVFPEHFHLREFTRSATADRFGFENVPDHDQTLNLIRLAWNILVPLRKALGSPIIPTSGFRGRRLNTLVGGDAFSDHLEGRGSDIIAVGIPPKDVFQALRDLALPSIDQVILEFDEWVHVSIQDDLDLQLESLEPHYLIATRTLNGRPTYHRPQ